MRAPDLRIELVGPEQAAAYTAVHRSSFQTEVHRRAVTHDDRWLPYADARYLIGYDERGDAVAEAALQAMGSSSAVVRTVADAAAVATYQAAGFRLQPVRQDRTRNA